MTHGAALRAGVLNIFDERTDKDGYNYRIDGRSFFASVTTTF